MVDWKAEGKHPHRDRGRTFIPAFLLVFAAGVSLLPAEAFSQASTYLNSNVSWSANHRTYSTGGTLGYTAQGRHRVIIQAPFGGNNWQHIDIYACPWTSATPTSATTRPTGCVLVRTGNAGYTANRQADVTWTPNQALLNNGATALVSWVKSGSDSGNIAMVFLWNTYGIWLSRTTPLTVPEQTSSTYDVRLSRGVSSDVVIRVTSSDMSSVTVNKAGGTAGSSQDLTFSSANWNTAQAITVNAVNDGNAVSETVTLTHAVQDMQSHNTYDPVPDSTLTVNAQDNDHGLSVSTTSLTVQEESATASTYTLMLASQPTGTVTVNPSVSGTPPPATVAPTSLEFDATTWNTAQTVTVTAGHDDDADNEMATVSHTAQSSDANYNFATARATENVTLTVTDNDPAGLAVDPTTLALTEEDASLGSGTYTLALATRPGGAVTVTATVPAGETAVTIGPAGSLRTRTLEFDATTWNTAQTVTVTAGHDDDAHGETVTLSHTAASGDANYALATARVAENVTVTVTDNDPAALVVDPATLALTEEDASLGSGTYTLALATQPSGAVTVTATVPAGETATTIGPVGNLRTRTLEFDATTWNTAQTVTVTAGHDDDAGENTVTVSHTAQAAQATLDAAYTFATPRVAENVTVTVTDDDMPNLVVSATGLTGDGLGEGTEEVYTLALVTQPVNGLVTVTVTVANGPATVEHLQHTARESLPLEFSAATWNTAQEVTVATPEDDDGADGTVTVTHDPSGADYDTLATGSLTFTVVDDDTRGVTLSGVTLTVTPGGSTLTVTENQTVPYTVVLDTQPVGGPVTVTATSADENVATVDTDTTPASRVLVFTAGNWATAQTVPVAGTDDSGSTDGSVQITHAVTGADYEANGVTAQAMTVAVTDDDVPGLLVDPPHLTVGENAAGAYTVRLTTDPTGAVTVTVGVTPAGKVAVDTDPNTNGDQAELAFTGGSTGNWDTARTVRVRGLEDDDGVNATRTLTHGVGGAATYTGLTAQRRPSVAVEVTDDDTVGVTVDADLGTTGIQRTLRTLKEDPTADGGTTAHQEPYTVVLDTEPTAPVMVTITSSDAAAVTRAPEALTFTAANWQTAQTVTASAVTDADAADERETLTHALTGATEYVGEIVLDVTVEDDEQQGMTVDADPGTTGIQTGPLSVEEDGEASYTVVLTSAPVDPVVVRIRDDNPDVHAMPGLLQFSASDWQTAQTVTVRADGDADARADAATLTHTAGGGDYTAEAPAATLVVNVADDDAAVDVSRRAVTVLAGERNTYTVRLEAAPAGNVTVTVASNDATKATVGPASLVFGPTTWATPRVVTVTGAAAGSATLSHTVAGYGAVTMAATVAVTVTATTDILVVDPRDFELLAGTSVTYTVRLARQPTGAVMVRSNDDTEITPGTNITQHGPRTLTFDSTNWATAQQYRLSIRTRHNHIPGVSTILHTVTGALSGTNVAQVTVREVMDTRLILEPVPTPLMGRVGQEMNVRLGEGVTTVVAGNGAPGALNYVEHDLPSAHANTPFTYTLMPAPPPGLTFDGATRRLYGTPTTASAAATYTLTATDTHPTTRDTASRQFALTVETNPLPGFLEPESPVQHMLHREVRQALPAPDVPMGMTPRLTFVVTPALPRGLTYEPPTETMAPYGTGGRIVGVPTETRAQRQYTLTVVDAAGNEAVLRFRLGTGAAQVAPGPSQPGPTEPEPPGPTPGPSCGDAVVAAQEYRAGAAIAALVLPAATGGMGPLRYGVGPGLPAGLTYTAPADPTATGGVLTGVPVGAQAATAYTLTATEADGAETALLTFTIRVAGPGQIRAEEGTRTYALGGRAVTVTQAAGTLAGVELTLPGRLAQDVAIRLRPPGTDVPLARGRYGFGPAGAQAAVEMAVTPVPEGGLDVCVPVPADVRAAARERAVQLVRYVGGRWARWARVAGATAEPDRVCGAGLTWFGPLAVGYANGVPTFGDRTIPAQTGVVAAALGPVALPAATEGDGPVRYALAPALPAGLTYTLPTEATAGVIAGVPTEAQPATTYTLTATDVDGDAATLPFTLAVEREPVAVTIADATAQEGTPVAFGVTLSRALAQSLTIQWTAGRPGSATPGEDYAAAGHVVLAAGTTAGTLRVPTVDDRRVEPTETFTVTVALPDDPLIEVAEATGRIEDDDTEQARRRSLGMVLAGVGRTLATDAVDVIGDRFLRQPSTAQATVGGQALNLNPQTGRWRRAAGVTYGVARALGVEVGSPLAGGDGQLGQVRGAAWSALTRHVRDPHAAATPLSAWDAPGAFTAPAGTGSGGPPPTGWGSLGHAGEVDSIPPGGVPTAGSVAGGTPFGRGAFPGLAGYGTGLGQLGFDRAHAATPRAMKVGAFRAPVQFRRVSGAEVLQQSEFEIPLRRPTSPEDPPTPARVTAADPAAPVQPVETAPQAEAAAWTLWGRGTASGFDGRPKDDFSMDGNVFTGYLGLDYRLQPNVLLGLAVAHSRGDVDYETRDVTKGDVDVTLTSVLPYAHWSPRPGLGVWGLFGAGWGDLDLKDEAGKVGTDLEMLMGAVGARQELLTWGRVDVALKADAFLTELEAGADDRLPKTAGDAQRLRLMLEGRTAWALSEESSLTPIFEVGGRWDGGKAETGVGAELGGGVEYAHTKLGLGIEARGRYLLAHQKSAFDEWGASLTLKLDPGADKRGLWLALAPVWGAEASQVEQMWGSADVLQAGADSATKPGLSPAQVEFDVGYGLVTYEGAGLLTTYGGVSMAGPQSHGYRVGGRIELGEWIDLSVEGERTTQGGGAEHQVGLYGHLGW